MRTPAPYVLVWVLFAFAWASNFTIRIGFSTLLVPIMKELDLSYTQGGTLAAAFFYAYVVMQLPSGLLGDRFGRRRILVLGLLGVAAATVLTSLASSAAALFAARLLTGACQGSLFSNDRAIIVAVTPPDRIAVGQGISFSGPGIGLTLGLLLGGVLADIVPWRVALALFAAGPLLAALAVQRWVPPIPAAAAATSLMARVRAVAGERRLWLMASAGGGAIYTQFVLATWAPLVFVEVGVEGLSRAGAYASLQGLAALAGPAVGGWADDRLRRRGVHHASIIAGVLAAIAGAMALMSLAIVLRSPLAVGVALVVASFLAWSIWGAVYALLGETVQRADLGAAFGLVNTICFLGAIIGPSVTGLLRDVTGSFVAGCGVTALVALAGAPVALALRRLALRDRR